MKLIDDKGRGREIAYTAMCVWEYMNENTTDITARDAYKDRRAEVGTVGGRDTTEAINTTGIIKME